jgi:DNA-directed RNA polymerase subunit RPC12/RpoP/uncharacterized membrane protein
MDFQENLRYKHGRRLAMRTGFRKSMEIIGYAIMIIGFVLTFLGGYIYSLERHYSILIVALMVVGIGMVFASVLLFSFVHYAETEEAKMKTEERAEQERRHGIFEAAASYERARRFEDAAKIYEDQGMWKEAGRVRRRARKSKSVTIRNVNADLNKLMQQLREGDITTTYRCSNCGASINISGETSAESLRFCNHCGATLKTIDLVDFIQKIL